MAQQEPPDLILLDVLMPGLDGFEVCRRLQADPRTCEIPVIFITALGDHENETVGFQVGGRGLYHQALQSHGGARPGADPSGVEGGLGCLARRKCTAGVAGRGSGPPIAGCSRSAARERHRHCTSPGLAAEYKDDQTGRHVLRMATMRWQWPDSWAGTPRISIDSSTLLSCTDIGKLALPDSILKRQDR